MADVDCTVRKCIKCHRELSLSCFYQRRDRPGKWRTECRECAVSRSKTSGYYAENKGMLLARAKEKYEAATATFLSRVSSYKKSTKGRDAMQRRRERVNVRLSRRIGLQVWRMLRQRKAGEPAAALVGWTIDDLRCHLEKQFLKGMGWHNMGEWHIDHIVPLASFTITGPEDPELRRAWALSNLRPLWAVENMRKGAKQTHLI